MFLWQRSTPFLPRWILVVVLPVKVGRTTFFVVIHGKEQSNSLIFTIKLVWTKLADTYLRWRSLILPATDEPYLLAEGLLLSV